MLELRSLEKSVSGKTHISDANLTIERGALHVLLGPTRSGKTTLMRLMAGLDKPSTGRILVDGEDVTGVAVRKRDVAMVYQQFVNYPSMSVYDNIASPLRLRREGRDKIDQKVQDTARALGLETLLARRPDELSGGQQQRVSLARALVKDASLILLDEPLANLDYKLREELRAELPRLFKQSGAMVVYATSEPKEALLIGDRVSCLHKGAIVETGAPRALYERPQRLITAQIMSEPPLNIRHIQKQGALLDFGDGRAIKAASKIASLADGPYTIGLRAHHLSIEARSEAGLPAVVSVAEVTGSQTLVHAGFGGGQWAAQLSGVHGFNAGDEVSLHPRLDQMFVFSEGGALIASPGE